MRKISKSKQKPRHGSKPTDLPTTSQKTALTTTPQLSKASRGSIRLIAKDLVGVHSTEIAMQLREGMLSRNLRLALKYLTFVGDRTDGRPVETHRMVGLQEGPVGSYDLTKLKPTEQKALLGLLRAAKDNTEPKGEA